MFKIYGGALKFQQWSKNQKLSMKDLPIGAEILFYNDPGDDEPLITEVYEIQEPNSSICRVCDVPNILLTDTRTVKVRIPEKVVGQYGVVHKYVGGPRERYFTVEPADKPADYVYEETPVKGGSNVSDEKIEAAVEKYMEENKSDLGIGLPGGTTEVWFEYIE